MAALHVRRARFLPARVVMTEFQYTTRVEAGECVASRSCENPAVPGRLRCEYHLLSQRLRALTWRDKHGKAAADLKLRLERHAAGVCELCAKAPVQKFRKCVTCRRRAAVSVANKRAGRLFP